MAAPLLTLRAIALELGLPESTVRYYRDVFSAQLPTTGRGRRRRYPADALPLFRLIADGFAENRTRDEIAAVLTEHTGDAAPVMAEAPRALVPSRHWIRPQDESAHELLTIVLDGERERREVMWQMAREIVRLGEAIERQHVVLHTLAENLERRAERALPPPGAARGDGAVLRGELDKLRAELRRERELVDRLRKSKLEIERRAAEAEEALGHAGDHEPRGVLRRRRPKRSDQ